MICFFICQKWSIPLSGSVHFYTVALTPSQPDPDGRYLALFHLVKKRSPSVIIIAHVIHEATTHSLTHSLLILILIVFLVLFLREVRLLLLLALLLILHRRLHRIIK